MSDGDNDEASKAECIEIVHGWSDDVIPPEHSIRYARDADCSLHLISGDHRLNSWLVQVLDLLGLFLTCMEAARKTVGFLRNPTHVLTRLVKKIRLQRIKVLNGNLLRLRS